MSGLAQPAAYHILRDGGEYREYGGDSFDRKNPQSTARRLAERLQRIGFDVALKPSARPIMQQLPEMGYGVDPHAYPQTAHSNFASFPGTKHLPFLIFEGRN